MSAPDRIWAWPERQLMWLTSNVPDGSIPGYSAYIRHDAPADVVATMPAVQALVAAAYKAAAISAFNAFLPIRPILAGDIAVFTACDPLQGFYSKEDTWSFVGEAQSAIRDLTPPDATAALAQLLDAARKEERERCARIADEAASICLADAKKADQAGYDSCADQDRQAAHIARGIAAAIRGDGQ